jgi:hypothetical protein
VKQERSPFGSLAQAQHSTSTLPHPPEPTSNSCWNLRSRWEASMGSSPGTVGPLASQSARKAAASATNARTSRTRVRLKPACGRQGEGAHSAWEGESMF